MAKGSRRRVEPADQPGVTHNVGALTGLGATDDHDAEFVHDVGDAVQYTASERLFTAQGLAEAKSPWMDCEDSQYVRIKIEYSQGTGTRVFCVGLRAHDGAAVEWSRLQEPDNPGFQDDVLVPGNYNAVGFQPVNCRGMKDFCLKVLAGNAGDPSVDAWGHAT